MLFKRRVDTSALTAVIFGDAALQYARVARSKGRRAQLLAAAVAPLGSGQHRQAAAELRRLLESIGAERSLCTTTLPADAYQLLLVDAPEVPASELRAAVRWRIKDLIDFHVDDAAIDVFEIPEQRRSGQSRVMYAVAARAPAVERLAQRFADARAELGIIDIPEMCLRNLAALTEEDIQGVALLQIEAGNGLLTLTRQETLYLARRFDLRPAREADDHTDHAAIALEVQRSLDYYESHFSQATISALYVLPGAADDERLREALQSTLGVRILPYRIESLVEVGTGVDRQALPQCLTAVGAALRQESLSL